MNDHWQATLGNDVFTSKLCAVAIDEAHVIRQWQVMITLFHVLWHVVLT